MIWPVTKKSPRFVGWVKLTFGLVGVLTLGGLIFLAINFTHQYQTYQRYQALAPCQSSTDYYNPHCYVLIPAVVTSHQFLKSYVGHSNEHYYLNVLVNNNQKFKFEVSPGFYNSTPDKQVISLKEWNGQYTMLSNPAGASYNILSSPYAQIIIYLAGLIFLSGFLYFIIRLYRWKIKFYRYYQTVYPETQFMPATYQPLATWVEKFDALLLPTLLFTCIAVLVMAQTPSTAVFLILIGIGLIFGTFWIITARRHRLVVSSSSIDYYAGKKLKKSYPTSKVLGVIYQQGGGGLRFIFNLYFNLPAPSLNPTSFRSRFKAVYNSRTYIPILKFFVFSESNLELLSQLEKIRIQNSTL